MKNKTKLVALVLVAISVIAIVTAIVLLRSNKKKDTNSNDSKQTIYYHCEGEKHAAEDGSNYKFINNYDFSYFENKLSDYNNYVKTIFATKDEYDKLQVDTSKYSVKVYTKEDEEHLVKYYSFRMSIAGEYKTADEYKKAVEKEYEVTCKKVEYDDLVHFNYK